MVEAEELSKTAVFPQKSISVAVDNAVGPFDHPVGIEHHRRRKMTGCCDDAGDDCIETRLM